MKKCDFRLPKDISVNKDWSQIGVMLQATQLIICHPKSKIHENF